MRITVNGIAAEVASDGSVMIAIDIDREMALVTLRAANIAAYALRDATLLAAHRAADAATTLCNETTAAASAVFFATIAAAKAAS